MPGLGWRGLGDPLQLEGSRCHGQRLGHQKFCLSKASRPPPLIRTQKGSKPGLSQGQEFTLGKVTPLHPGAEPSSTGATREPMTLPWQAGATGCFSCTCGVGGVELQSPDPAPGGQAPAVWCPLWAQGAPGPSWASRAHLHPPYLLRCSLGARCPGCCVSVEVGLSRAYIPAHQPWHLGCGSQARGVGWRWGVPGAQGGDPVLCSAGLLTFRRGRGSGAVSRHTPGCGRCQLLPE